MSDNQIKRFAIFLMEQAVIPVKESIMSTDLSWKGILLFTSIEKNILNYLIVCRRQATHFGLYEDLHGPAAREVYTFVVNCHSSPGCFISGNLLKDFTCQKIYHTQKCSF